MRRIFGTLAVATVAFAAVPAFAQIKIGAAGPMTGSDAVFGEQMKRGAEMAVKDINAAGGVNGQKLELVVGDDACDPKQATAVANKMVSDKVVFVAERMIAVRVSVTRYISDEPQPGIVECEFADAHGRRWTFVEKTAVVSADYLDARTSYPQPGVIACQIVGRRIDNTGREIVMVDTERPWGVEAVDGTVQFEVFPASLVEWEWGSNVKRAWDGRAEPSVAPDCGGIT